MNRRRTTRMIIPIVAAILSGGALISQWATAQTPPPVPPKGNLQRSAEIFSFKQSAESGAARGEEIYYFKCWICHNKYAKSAPWLGDIYERPLMVSGAPVNDETVAAKIRDGGPGMPAYRHTISDRDITDLVSYMREGRCCFDEENPPRNPRYRGETIQAAASGAAAATPTRNLRGGPKGVVRESTGEPLEGIMVQLVSHRSAIRTTVYSNEEGRYEFPRLETGVYTLRIARPMEFRPYQRDSVSIAGATALEDIVLEQITDRLSEFLPPTAEVLAQLTGAEWLLNLPGTGQEKKIFSRACGLGCHSYQQIFRNRYDEHGWRRIVNRMLRFRQSPLIVPRSAAESRPENEPRATPAEEEVLVNWLARIRAPESKDAPLQALPGPRGDATRVIVTEYELPRLLMAPHDIAADAEGGLWYTPHRSPYIGKLDPKTGVVTEYRVPRVSANTDVGFAHPGTHGIWVDKQGIVWMTEQIWDQPGDNFTGLDPRTGEFTQRKGFACAVGPDGSVWTIQDGAVAKRDIRTDRVIREIPIPKAQGTYNCTMSDDGNFVGGGSWPSDYTVYYDVRTGRAYEQETRTPRSMPARGGFDPKGNLWLGGRGGNLIRVAADTHRISEFWPPTPYVTFYEAMADKNGEAWAAELNGGRVARFNPVTGKWIEYVLPEPFSHNRRAWIDNSTDPVTFWYVDHNGWMVGVQPLE